VLRVRTDRETHHHRRNARTVSHADAPGGRWVAVHGGGDFTITVAADDVELTPMEREPISDPPVRFVGADPVED
jgi:hypothetical protein